MKKVSQLQRVTDMSHVFKNTHARDSQGYTSWLLKKRNQEPPEPRKEPSGNHAAHTITQT